MTPGDRADHGDHRAAYRALPAGQRRAVRRAARRGHRGQVAAALAGPLLDVARRRRRRARRALVLAVVLILASAAAAVWLLLRAGPGPLLAVPAAALLVGGVAGLVSEARLRRAEEAEALAERQLRRRAEAAAPARPTLGGPDAPATIEPVAGDAARERLARILSGTPVVRPGGQGAGAHPWD